MLIGAEGSSAAGQDDDEPMLQAVHRLGHLYANQDKLDEAEMYRRALEGKEKALGHDHTSTLATANDLGTLYADQDKLDEAEEMCWQGARRIREGTWARPHVNASHGQQPWQSLR